MNNPDHFCENMTCHRASTGHATAGEFYWRRGKGRQHNPIQIGGEWMVSVDSLRSGLSELIAVKNGPREWCEALSSRVGFQAAQREESEGLEGFLRNS